MKFGEVNDLDDRKWELVICPHCKYAMGEPQHKYGCPMSGDQVSMPGVANDGYHTFDQLYQYRMLFNAMLFNEWALNGKYEVHKSMRHSDGLPCFGGGWFIVVAELPTGQISNHYKLAYWELFKVPEFDLPNAYDGHTPAIAATRMFEFLTNTRSL